MRTSVKLGAGLASTALAASLAAGVATAAVSGPHRATAASLAAATSAAHITKKQARHLARAAVPHSTVIEIESDDLHDRAVWKVKLSTPHGRVVVAVDKRTGKVTILHGHRHGGGGGGDDHVLLSARSATLILSSRDRGFEPGDDRGVDQRGDDRGFEPGDDRGVDQRGDDHGGLGQAGAGHNRGNGGQDDGHDAGHGHGGHGGGGHDGGRDG